MSKIQRLIDIMAALRNPQTGCSWDLKQNHKSLIPFLIEESYEVIDAIESDNDEHFCEELGDLLFQIIFHAQLASEQEKFSFDDIAEKITQKLIHRHPHVFSDKQYQNEAEQNAAWEKFKTVERKSKQPDNSVLNGIPVSFPALMYSQKLQRRAANAGFDWENIQQVIPKISEELNEVIDAVENKEPQHRIEEEVGDLLFAVVNLARKLNIDAENALRIGNHKFSRRFRGIEQKLKAADKQFDQVSLEKLESLWQEIKSEEKSL